MIRRLERMNARKDYCDRQKNKLLGSFLQTQPSPNFQIKNYLLSSNGTVKKDTQN